MMRPLLFSAIHVREIRPGARLVDHARGDEIIGDIYQPPGLIDAETRKYRMLAASESYRRRIEEAGRQALARGAMAGHNPWQPYEFTADADGMVDRFDRAPAPPVQESKAQKS